MSPVVSVRDTCASLRSECATLYYNARRWTSTRTRYLFTAAPRIFGRPSAIYAERAAAAATATKRVNPTTLFARVHHSRATYLPCCSAAKKTCATTKRTWPAFSSRRTHNRTEVYNEVANRTICHTRAVTQNDATVVTSGLKRQSLPCQ